MSDPAGQSNKFEISDGLKPNEGPENWAQTEPKRGPNPSMEPKFP